jgi:hypothetical protein
MRANATGPGWWFCRGRNPLDGWDWAAAGSCPAHIDTNGATNRKGKGEQVSQVMDGGARPAATATGCCSHFFFFVVLARVEIFSLSPSHARIHEALNIDKKIINYTV